MNSKYYLMDGRAHLDFDAATVLETCNTLEEALASIDNYGADTCVVEVATQQIVHSLMWSDEANAIVKGDFYET